MTKKFDAAIAGLIASWEGYDDDPQTFWAAVDACKDSAPKRPEPIDGFRTHAAYLTFADEVAKYDARSGTIDEAPPDSFWSALKRLYESTVANIAPPGHPGSIASLTKQNIDDGTICRTWGLVDEHGRPDIEALEAERVEPGSRIKEGQDWPTLTRWKAARQAEYDAYADGFKATQQASAQAARKPCPETPEELYRLGVDVEQASRMLMQEVAAVKVLYDSYRESGIPHGKPETDKRGEAVPEYQPTAPRPDPLVDAQEDATDAAASSGDESYRDMSDEELQGLCEALSLEADGDRQSMIERLKEYDEETAPTA